MGVILGAAVAGAAEVAAPGLGPLANCEDTAVAAPEPDSSGWSEHPFADT